MQVPSVQIERDVTVPLELSERFADELSKDSSTNAPEHNASDHLSSLLVKDGLEVFFCHFNAV